MTYHYVIYPLLASIVDSWPLAERSTEPESTMTQNYSIQRQGVCDDTKLVTLQSNAFYVTGIGPVFWFGHNRSSSNILLQAVPASNYVEYFFYCNLLLYGDIANETFWNHPRLGREVYQQYQWLAVMVKLGNKAFFTKTTTPDIRGKEWNTWHASTLDLHWWADTAWPIRCLWKGVLDGSGAFRP